MKKIKYCRSCSSKKLDNLFSLGNHNYTGIFSKTKNLKTPAGELKLIKCKICSLVQLSENFNLKKIYGNNYGYRTGLNSSMVNHIKTKIKNIKKKIKIKSGDVILDIGSNDGTLLKCFNYKKYELIGIDPTISKFKKYYPKEIKTVAKFFSKKNLDKTLIKKKVKLVTSIAMFYDLPDPVSFAKDIYKLLDDDGIWHLEQSYSGHMLKNLSYDTICHEHLEYYSLKSIKYIFDKCNLKIIDIKFNEINGGSFAISVAKKNSSLKVNELAIQKILNDEIKNKINSTIKYKNFFKRIYKEKIKLVSLLSNLKNNNKVVFGYGASTKGNVILQYCNFKNNQIKFICDVNKDKENCYTPGSNIKIISENFAKKLKPDYYIVLPWHFKNFILEKEKSLIKSGTRFIFPLPTLQIY
jgi:cyclopropane fatty-acyl-phospholipid synthase-like methyltransferase